jgi:hypothetical protein
MSHSECAYNITFPIGIKYMPRLLIILLVCEIILMVVAAVLWIAVGFQVGLQESELQHLI